MQPLGDRILIRDIATEETADGGVIALLEDTRENLTEQQAEVVAVGPGGRDEDGDLIPMDERLKPGTWIITEGFVRVPTDDPTLFLIRAADVVAVVE